MSKRDGMIQVTLDKHVGNGAEFKFNMPLHIKPRHYDVTVALDAFELNPEYVSACKLFFKIDRNGMEIKVQVQSQLIFDISSVVLYSTSGYQFTFDQFTTTPDEPNECLSNKIIGNNYDYYQCGYPLFGQSIRSGLISYTIRANSVEKALLRNSLEMGKYHDLIIKLDNGKEFKVHKMVLAFRSKVFEKMIDSDMMENKTGVIHIRDMETNVMQEVLNHIYCLPCDLSKSPHSIFRAAHLYELNELTNRCRNYMINNINYKNFVEILKLTNIEAYELKGVHDALNDFLKNKESEIVKNAGFIKSLSNNMHVASIHYLFRLCMQHNLKVKEKVTIFILENLDKVLQNSEFTNFLLSHPESSIEIFGVLTSNWKLDKLLPN